MLFILVFVIHIKLFWCHEANWEQKVNRLCPRRVFLGAASVRGGWLANCSLRVHQCTQHAPHTHRRRDLRNCKNSERTALGAYVHLCVGRSVGVRACGPGIDSNIWVNAPLACTHDARWTRAQTVYFPRGRTAPTRQCTYLYTHKLILWAHNCKHVELVRAELTKSDAVCWHQ